MPLEKEIEVQFVWSQKMQNLMIDLFKKHGGQLRMTEAIQLGITRYTLYSLRDQGVIEPVTRGIYRLAELPPFSNPDLAAVSLRYPNSVICLISALSFHELTTQIPHQISIAVARNARPPKLDFPPLQAHRFSPQAFQSGVQMPLIDGVQVKVYSPEKTLADCFKYRNTIGLDVVLEALRFYKIRMEPNLSELLKQAKSCRVQKVMRPYLEAIL
jgi:predicted transcriptional regulator of viral defense system